MSKRKGLRVQLDVLKAQYLDMCGPGGGDASGYRKFVQGAVSERPDFVSGYVDELIDEAAKGCWQKRPRQNGPDLFSIAGIPVPDHVTRRASGADGPVDDEHGDGFRKVSHQHATVRDLLDNASIKGRKAAEAGEAAAKLYKQGDEAKRRAKGNTTVFLRDIADKT